MSGWLARRAARKQALAVGSEVIAIIRDVSSALADFSQLRSEVARRLAEADFLSTRGLMAVQRIDEREAAWLETLRRDK